jgi:hypothetical protein
MDERKALEAEYAALCDRIQHKVDLIVAVNKTLQDTEVWESGAKETINNRANILKNLDSFNGLAEMLEFVASKIKEE